MKKFRLYNVWRAVCSECRRTGELSYLLDEERQYVDPKGQSWTTLESLQTSDTYKNEIIEEENGLFSITTKPGFADWSNGICGENRIISFTMGLYYLFR